MITNALASNISADIWKDLSHKDTLYLCATSRYFSNICSSNIFWRQKAINKYGVDMDDISDREFAYAEKSFPRRYERGIDNQYKYVLMEHMIEGPLELDRDNFWENLYVSYQFNIPLNEVDKWRMQFMAIPSRVNLSLRKILNNVAHTYDVTSTVPDEFIKEYFIPYGMRMWHSRYRKKLPIYVQESLQKIFFSPTNQDIITAISTELNSYLDYGDFDPVIEILSSLVVHSATVFSRAAEYIENDEYLIRLLNVAHLQASDEFPFLILFTQMHLVDEFAHLISLWHNDRDKDLLIENVDGFDLLNEDIFFYIKWEMNISDA